MAGVVRRDRSDRRPVIGYHEIRREQSTFYCPVRRRRLETDATDPLELPLAHSGLGFQADRTGHRHPEGCRRQKIAFGYDHIRERKSRVLIDGKSLQPVGTREASDRVSAQLRAIASSFPGMPGAYASARQSPIALGDAADKQRPQACGDSAAFGVGAL